MLTSPGQDQNKKLMGRNTGILTHFYTNVKAGGSGLEDEEEPQQQQQDSKSTVLGFPGGAVVEDLPANAGDTGLSPGLGRSHMPRSN